MPEIKRVKNVEINDCYETNCVKCGKKIELHWNGGELDYRKCCGLTYSLEHTEVDLVIYN